MPSARSRVGTRRANWALSMARPSSMETFTPRLTTATTPVNGRAGAVQKCLSHTLVMRWAHAPVARGVGPARVVGQRPSKAAWNLTVPSTPLR